MDKIAKKIGEKKGKKIEDEKKMKLWKKAIDLNFCFVQKAIKKILS